MATRGGGTDRRMWVFLETGCKTTWRYLALRRTLFLVRVSNFNLSYDLSRLCLKWSWFVVYHLVGKQGISVPVITLEVNY